MPTWRKPMLLLTASLTTSLLACWYAASRGWGWGTDLPRAFGASLGLTVTAIVSACTSLLCLWRILPEGWKESKWWTPLAVCAVWQVTVLVLAVRQSRFTAAVAGVFAFLLTRLIVEEVRRARQTIDESHIEGITDRDEPPILFGVLPSPDWSWLFVSFLCALLLMAGLGSAVRNEDEFSALLWMSAGSLLVFLIARREDPSTEPIPRRRRQWLVAVLAVLLMTGSLNRQILRFPFGDDPNVVQARTVLNPGELTDEEAHRGVLLFVPKRQKRVEAPPERSWMSPRSPRATSEAEGIAFTGVYWLFKAPDTRPPANSFVEEGTPDRRSFRSLGGTPIRMEAYQRLPRPVSLACCSSIRMTADNTDRYFNTVELEMVLIHRSTAGRTSLSLGRQPLRHSQPFRYGRVERARVREEFRFDIPTDANLREFDEIGVIFHLAPMRASHSARVSIDHFYLEP